MLRARAVAGLVVVVAATSSCAPEERSEVLLASGFQVIPLDTVEEGVLAEGKERAFGLALPRDARIKARMADAWYAEGRLSFEHVAEYLRERLEPEREDVSERRLVFVKAAVVGQPGKIVTVELTKKFHGSEIVVRDRRAPPIEEGLSEDERWRQVGLTPGGKVIEKGAL